MPNVFDLETAPAAAGFGLLAVVVTVTLLPALRDPDTIARLEREDGPELVVAEPEEQGKARRAPPAIPASGASSASPPAGAPSPRGDDDGHAPQEELDRAHTASDLAGLAKRHPGDTRVLAKLAKAEAATPEGLLGALATTRKVFTLDPAAVQSEDLRSIVRRGAAGPPDVASLAYDLMTASMGAGGVDLLFEISTAQGASKTVRDRALAATKNADVRAKASPALLVALDLRDSVACDRKKHFDRAAAAGDARSLQFLTPLTATKGCGVFGLGDCYSGCRGTGGQLNAAIKAIRDRVK